MLSDSMGQVDFPSGHPHMSIGQGISKSSAKNKLRIAQGKQNLRANLPKGKLEFKFLSSPALLGFMNSIHY